MLTSVYEGCLELISALERRNHDFFYRNIIPVTRDLFESTHHGILLPPNWQYKGEMDHQHRLLAITPITSHPFR